MNILTPLNDLIKYVHSVGLSGPVYWMWHIINFVAVCSFCLINRKHYSFNRKTSLLAPLFVYAGIMIIMLLVGWIGTGFTRFGDNNAVKGFCFVPLVTWLVAKPLKLDWRELADFAAPALALAQAVGHLQCVFAGCCNGYPMEHGLWNPVWNIYCFPEQLLECFVAFLIVIAGTVIARKQNYEVRGVRAAYFMVMFGSTRFLLEFLRANWKLFWGISELALWALLMVVVGVVWLIIDKKQNKKVQRSYYHRKKET